MTAVMSIPVRRLYEFGEFRLDPAERLLLRAGEPVTLTPKAFELLIVLVSQSGRLLTKEELMRAVWGETAVEENNLNKNIAALRKALGQTSNETGAGQQFIETVRGYGFRFTVPVVEIESSPSPPPASAVGVPALTYDMSALAAGTPAIPPAVDPLPVTLEPLHQPLSLSSKQANPAIVLTGLFLSLVAITGFWWSKVRDVKQPDEIKLTPLMSGGDILAASLSPDGKFFAYVNTVDDGQGMRLWLRQTAGGQPIAIGPRLTVDQSILGTTFSPDGQFVYYTLLDSHEPAGALYRVGLLGGAATKVLAGISSSVNFSPNRQQLAFIRRDTVSRLIIADSTGNNERTVLTRNVSEVMPSVSWSPDGKEIACQFLDAVSSLSEYVWTIQAVNVQSGATRLLTPQRWKGLGRLAWLGDGSGLVVAGTKSGQEGTARDPLWLIAQPSGIPRRLTLDTNRYSYDSLSVSQDGQALLTIALNRPSQIWSVPAQGQGLQARYEARDAIPLTAGNREGLAGLASSADGRIVYIARGGERLTLWQMAPAGKQPVEIPVGPPLFEELVAPHHGNFFVFASTFAGREHLFRVEHDGTNLRQLTNGQSYESDSDISPDGRWIVYASQSVSDKFEHTLLWKMSAEGGEAQRLTNYEAFTPHFSPDGHWLSFIYLNPPRQWKLGVISATTGGAPNKSFDLSNQVATNVGGSWTPDGQALSYIVTKKYVSNLWAQPLAGGAPYPITNFTSGVIYRYAFDRSGQRLYLARGHPLNEVLLLNQFRGAR